MGSKIHIIMGKEEEICVDITGAQTHDSKPVEEMLNHLSLQEIERFVADKAYDTNKIRDFLKNNGIHAEIPNKKNRKSPSDSIKQFINGDIESNAYSKN